MGVPRFLLLPSRQRIPHLELQGGNGAPLDVGGTLVLPQSGDEYVGQLLELQQSVKDPLEVPEVRCD